MNSDNLKVLGGVIAGVAIGTVIGLLTAPDSGEETRKKLDYEASKFKDGLAKALGDTFEALKNSFQETTKEATSNVKEIISENVEESEGEITGHYSREELKKKAGEV